MMDGGIQASLADGLYFSLPEDVYHAQPRLSASGIKNLLVSPMDFWARSWMNPNKPGVTEDDEPEWAIKGKAYHKRVCEGREAFYASYAPEMDANAHPKALKTVDDLKNALKEAGEPISGNKPILIARLLEKCPDAQILEMLERDHAKKHAGKILIPPDWFRDIEIAAACIEKHPTLSKCFQGGQPEVSILYTADVERNDGSGEVVRVPMKARLDFLKAGAIVDFKTYSNKMMKPIDRAVYFEMAARKYHLQAAVYYAAMEAACAHIDAGNIQYCGSDEQCPSKEWLKAVRCTEKKFVWVLQQKGIAPVACGYVMPAYLGIISVGQAQVREAQQLFMDCLSTFGTDPWVMDREMQEIADNDIPNFATE